MNRHKPSFGEEYFIPYIGSGSPSAEAHVWTSTSYDFTCWRSGIIFNTREDATTMAEQILSHINIEPISVGMSYGKTICPSCNIRTDWDISDANDQEINDIKYCPYCGQRIKLFWVSEES